MAVKARSASRTGPPKPKPAQATVPPSRQRLLDAAEVMFAERGYDGVALRSIADAANVNLGSIPYFFGTKENLFKAVLLRRIEPIQVERKARMHALLNARSEMTLEKVLSAFLEPVFRESGEHAAFRKLAARCATDPAPEVRRIMNEIYDASSLLTPKALRIVCPKLSDQEFFWRLTCLYGSMFYIQADTGRMQNVAGKPFDTSRPDAALTYLIPAFAAFFRAPPNRTHQKRNGRRARSDAK